VQLDDDKYHFVLSTAWKMYNMKQQMFYYYIKAQRLSWFGHLHRMPEERMVKKIYKWKPMLRRPLRKPKNRWEDDIRNDIKKLKIKNWTNCIQDRKNWKLYVEQAKTFKELKL
jgi:hypothetical protein